MNRIKIVVTFLLITLGFYMQAQELPSPMQPPRLVNDFASMLTLEEQQALEIKLRNYHDTTSTQIYVVVVSDLLGYDIADYAIRIGEKWGIGQKGKDNGALILVKPKNASEGGEAFIATGYGLEDVIPDALAMRIMQNEFIPSFKNDHFYTGFDDATTAIMNFASGKFSPDHYDGEGGDGVWVIITFLVIFSLVSLVLKSGGSSSSYTGSAARRGAIIGTASRSSYSSFSSGRSSFGGFSGGGGGSFGGGGARGSW